MADLARTVFWATSAVPDHSRTAGHRRPLLRGGIAISTSVVCVAALAMLTAPRLGYSQTAPACQQPKNAVLISQANGSLASTEIHAVNDASDSRMVDGILHLYLRNEGSTQPDQLCANVHLSDIKGAPRAAFIALSEPTAEGKSVVHFEEGVSCFKIKPPWQAFQEIPFDVHLRVASNVIPLSGSIDLNSDFATKETPTDRNADSPHDCVSSSKSLSRSVMLVPAISSSWIEVPLVGSFTIALAYLLISLWVLRENLENPVCAPQWNFATSFASNFTIGTGLLTPLLGANVITDELHYMTKFHYVLLSILFAGLLLLAPAIFSFLSVPREIKTPAGQTSTASIGTVGLFLATSAVMVCAVLGQLITVGLAFAEVRFRGYIGYAPVAVMISLLLVAGVGTIVSAERTGSYLGQGSGSIPTSHDLRNIGEKVKSLTPEESLGSARSSAFTPTEQRTFEHLMGRAKTAPRTWNMF